MSDLPKRYRYAIDLNELDYATLMKIVMKYGTSTGEGVSTPTTLRLALADAQIRIDRPEQKEARSDHQD